MSFENLKHSLSLQPVIFHGRSTVRWNDGTIERRNGGRIRNLDDSLLPRTVPLPCPPTRTYTTPRKKEKKEKKKIERSEKMKEDEKNGDKVAKRVPYNVTSKFSWLETRQCCNSRNAYSARPYRIHLSSPLATLNLNP